MTWNEVDWDDPACKLPDFEQETVEGMEWHPTWCDDCGRWHQGWSGVEVDAGEVCVVTYDGDHWNHDGPWKDEWAKATVGHYERTWTEVSRAARQAQVGYWQDVLETGEDPLNEVVGDRDVREVARASLAELRADGMEVD